MEESRGESDWQSKLLPIIRVFTEGGLVLAYRNVLGVLEVGNQLCDRIRYHGMYEILDCSSLLDIHDASGEEATLTRREVIRFLQDNVVVIHDYAWGDGELFAEYQCRPRVPVDFYQDSSKWNILISLRETKNRGDELDFRIEREIK